MTVEKKVRRNGDYMKRWQAALRDKGLCAYCGKPLEKSGSSWRCPACAQTQRQRNLARYYERVKKRLCVKCGKPLRYSEQFKMCFSCRLQEAEARKKRRNRQ